MVYQLSASILPYIISIDLILIGLLYLSVLPGESITRRFILAASIAGFVGLSFFKLLFTEPGISASTPINIEFVNKDLPSPVYYIRDTRNGKKVFWKDGLPKGKGSTTRTFEQEGNPEMILATRPGKVWQYTTISLRQDTTVTLEQSAFRNVEQPEIERAISKYTWVEIGNYASNFLVLAFVAILAWRMKIVRKIPGLKV